MDFPWRPNTGGQMRTEDSASMPRRHLPSTDAETELAIVGAGPAGLAAGQRAATLGLDFTVWERNRSPGGCCRTFEQDGFRFDSGAHRLHERDPRLIAELQALLTVPLRRVDSPSCILDGGHRIAFPLAPWDLLRNMGPRQTAHAVISLAAARLRWRPGRGERESFAAGAERTYGRHLARRFLLGYSEKLWGLPATELSNAISGRRLTGLTLAAFVAGALGGRAAATRHMDGTFRYPQGGIGAITDALAAACGPRLRLGRTVVGLAHDGRRISALTLADGSSQAARRFIATLPLDRLVAMLHPPPPAALLADAASLRYRSLVLVMLRVDQPTVSPYATIYLPDPALPITRIHEPRNRCVTMAPSGCTSLVAELPCWPDDQIWAADDGALKAQVVGDLHRLGLLDPARILGASVVRLVDAYPVLHGQHEAQVRRLLSWLARFENLQLAGRNARFAYLSLHESIAEGQAAVAEGNCLA